MKDTQKDTHIGIEVTEETLGHNGDMQKDI